MTPAVDAARKAGIRFQLHEYRHDPRAESYGEEAAMELGAEPGRIFKTLVVSKPEGSLAVGIVPVLARLDLKRMAASLDCKRVAMADPKKVQRSTGYVIGGVSPLGQRTPLQTVLDSSAADFATIFVSAGRRGLDLELGPADLQRLTDAALASIARD
jgi:Cys-tRNA(Pro)/Cys-tRNA(Cys) deacylase